MSKYTTGEIAKLCGVSVRTVQYYDTRNILVPSELSEGGRRLYNDDDLKRMKIICFLREAGLPINSISALFAEENAGDIINVILEQQEQNLRAELDEKQKQLYIIKNIRQEMKDLEGFSVESIGDIANIMKNKEKLKKLRAWMLVAEIVMDCIEVATGILWWQTGIWWPFALGMVGVVAISLWAFAAYVNSVSYICPQCHETFRPGLKEMFFAYHTPKMRRLTCPKCRHKGLCVEVFTKKEKLKYVEAK